jgi:hypothetical protein
MQANLRELKLLSLFKNMGVIALVWSPIGVDFNEQTPKTLTFYV